MTNFTNTSPVLLKRLDALTKSSHPFLKDTDEAYYLGEYTPRAQSAHSEWNRLIINFKKPMEKKGQAGWNYKELAISQIAELLRTSISHTIGLSDRICNATLVPIPPSKAKNSPEYDDRTSRLLQKLAPTGDIRELIFQKYSRTSLHESKNSPRDPDDLLGNYSLNQEILHPTPKEIWLVDDVLIKGTHFRAAHDFLKRTYPHTPIVGFFIARSIRQANL